MSTEIATTEQKPKRDIAVNSHGIQLRSIDDAWRFSTMVIQSGLAPFGFDTAQQVLIAIQCGAEVGLPPMQALQSIAVINRRPTIWGDAVPGLVHSGGKCEYIKEWIEGEGDARTAHCEAKRKDQSQPCHRMFSVADAKKAGLWQTQAIVTRRGKNGSTYEKENDSPWWKYPDRMLGMRARSWCLRDSFADAMRGLQIREEVEDYADNSIPGEVIESKPRLLSEIPDEPERTGVVEAAVEHSNTFWTLKTAIENGDTEGIHDDIASAVSDKSLTPEEASELRGMLA